MTNRSRRALQAAVGVACAAIIVSAVVGTDLPTTASSQVTDYAPRAAPGVSARGVAGVSNRVRAVQVPGYSGPVLVCRQPGTDCRQLTGTASVSIGAYLDTSKGAAQLETRRADGTYTATVVYAGLFRLQQARQPNAVLVARLQGQLPRGCSPSRRSTRAGASATKRKSRQPRRRLWSDGTGKFRATGRYGQA